MSNALSVWKHAFKETASSLKNAGSKVSSKTTDTLGALEKEGKFGPVLHEQVLGTIAAMKQKDSSLEQRLEEAYAYAVLPSVSKANLVLGAAYGFGEVFKGGRVVGYAGLVGLTLGVQVGGETFDAILVFDDADTFKRFKDGKYGFAANAAIAVLKARAEAAHGFGAGTELYVLSEGGLQIVAAIGIQKFIYKPAALGRTRSEGRHTRASEIGDEQLKSKPGDDEEPTRASADEEDEELRAAEEEEEEEEDLDEEETNEERQEPVALAEGRGREEQATTARTPRHERVMRKLSSVARPARRRHRAHTTK